MINQPTTKENILIQRQTGGPLQNSRRGRTIKGTTTNSQTTTTIITNQGQAASVASTTAQTEATVNKSEGGRKTRPTQGKKSRQLKSFSDRKGQ